MPNPIQLTGFSLLEMLIVIAIAGLSLAYGLSAYTHLIQMMNEKAYSIQLLSAIQMARTQAQLSGNNIIICPYRQKADCSGPWAAGFMVFYQAAGRQRLLLTTYSAKLTGMLYWRSFRRHAYLQLSALSAHKTDNGTFWYCRSDERVPIWIIRINHAGRAHLISKDVLSSYKCPVRERSFAPIIKFIKNAYTGHINDVPMFLEKEAQCQSNSKTTTLI